MTSLVRLPVDDSAIQSGTLAASARPAKLSRLDWDSCLCHNGLDRSRSDSEPLTSFTERSWKSLLHAAALRKDRTAVFLSENGADPSVPRGVYHRKCYQSYTHKRELDKLAARLAEGTASADDEQDHDDGE